MDKYVEYKKLSKKDKKRMNKSRRVQWSDYGCLSPVSRVVPNKKHLQDKHKCRGAIWYE